MELRVSDNVPAVTGILTVVSLALVFGAALQAIPTGLLPRSQGLIDVIPHLNAIISLFAIGTITAGVSSIRNGNVQRHRALMIASFVLFAGFLTLYLYRVALEGPTDFGGPALVETVYLAVLAIHILLAIAAVPLVYYTLLLGLTQPIRQIYGSAHPRAGRLAASLWLVSFTLGLVVYTILYVIYPAG